MKFHEYITEERSDKQRWNDYLSKNSMLKAAVKVLNKIEKAGFHALIVGGSVRDIILGHNPHDVDIATNMPMDKLEKIYKTHDIGKSKDFGIVVVKEGGHMFEVAQYRKDGKYSDGRRPDSVKICQNFKGDASRRDFCFNAMGIDKDGNIIDHFDGRKDIKNKVLRTVGNPYDRFEEDYIRMLRAVRFSGKLGFEIEGETKDAIKKLKGNLKKIAPERIKDELMKMASQSGDKFADSLVMLDEVGILEIILPEITKLKQFKHDPVHHPEDKGGTVLNHVLAAIRANKLKNPIVNLSILLHDVGKGVTAGTKENGYNNFLGHAGAAKDIILDIAKRLKLSNKERDEIMFATINHMKFHDIQKMKPLKVLNLVYNEYWETLRAVAYCDDACRIGLFKPKEWEKTINKIKEIEKKWSSKVAGNTVKVVDGTRVMKLTGLKPSKQVGEIISKVTDVVLAKGIKDQKEIDKLIKQIYKEML